MVTGHPLEYTIEITLFILSLNLLAAAGRWPDSTDSLLMAVFLVGVVAAPGLGYVLMVLDFRAYLRSLRRGLMRVVYYVPELPQWTQHETPRCVAAFGLRLPCGEEELKSAYLSRVKQLHPDRGGDRGRFMILQTHYEEAMKIVLRSAAT